MSDSRKIYFCGSIRAGCQDQELYLRIIKQLTDSYGKVLTEHAFTSSPAGDREEISPITGTIFKNDKEIHDLDMKWLEESNVLIAEVTQPSLGVGYEIGRAVAMNKKVLCLYRTQPDKRLSAMISGAHNGSTFIVKNYKEEEVPAILKEFFDNL